MSAQCDHVGNHAINSGSGQQQSNCPKNTEQTGGEPLVSALGITKSLVHGFEVANHLIGVDLPDGFAQGGNDCVGVAASANQQDLAPRQHGGKRQIDSGLRRFQKTAIARIGYHAHNFARFSGAGSGNQAAAGLTQIRNADGGAQRIGTGPVPAPGRLIDDRDISGPGEFGGEETTPASQGHFESGKVVAIHHAEQQVLICMERRASHFKRHAPEDVRRNGAHSRGRRLHTRHSAGCSQDAAQVLFAPFPLRKKPGPQVGGRNQDMGGVVAKFDVCDGVETTNGDSGSGQKYSTQTDLGHHQDIAQADCRSTAAGTTRRFLHSAPDRRPGELQRGRATEKNAGQYGDGKSETQNPNIEADIEATGNHSGRHDGQQRGHAHPRQRQATGAAGNRQQNGFGEELLCYPPPWRAHGQADGELPGAGTGAGQQQDGDITAGN